MVAYTVVAASVIVENIVTVMGGMSVQVPFLEEGNVTLGLGGLRLPLRRPVAVEGDNRDRGIGTGKGESRRGACASRTDNNR